MADKNFGKENIFWLLSGVLTGCLIVVVGNQRVKIKQMRYIRDSLVKTNNSLSEVNDSLQGKVIEYQSALKAYEKSYENQGK